MYQSMIQSCPFSRRSEVARTVPSQVMPMLSGKNAPCEGARLESLLAISGSQPYTCQVKVEC